jgi:hypothetical protein
MNGRGFNLCELRPRLYESVSVISEGRKRLKDIEEELMRSRGARFQSTDLFDYKLASYNEASGFIYGKSEITEM